MAGEVATFYGKFWWSLANKEIDMNSDQLKALLTTSAYTPDKDTHQYKSSVTNEVAGTGYTAGGLVISSPTITYDAANDRVVFDGADINWPNSAFTARRLVVYDNTPASDATRPLVMWVDFPFDYTPVGGKLEIIWNAIGFGYVTT